MNTTFFASRFAAYLFTAAAFFSVSACGILNPELVESGMTKTEKRAVTPFTEIRNTASMVEITVVVGQQHSIELTGDANFIEYYKTDIVNGQLNISFNPNQRFTQYKHTAIKVTIPSVEKILNEWGVIEITTSTVTLEAKNLTLEMLKLGRIRINNLQVENLTATVTGQGTIVLGGTTDNCTFKLNSELMTDLKDLQGQSGTGFLTRNLIAKKAVIETTGEYGLIALSVAERLDAAMNGKANLVYYTPLGTSPVINRTGNGAGTIRRGN